MFWFLQKLNLPYCIDDDSSIKLVIFCFLFKIYCSLLPFSLPSEISFLIFLNASIFVVSHPSSFLQKKLIHTVIFAFWITISVIRFLSIYADHFSAFPPEYSNCGGVIGKLHFVLDHSRIYFLSTVYPKVLRK